jgi:hypothetical protein
MSHWHDTMVDRPEADGAAYVTGWTISGLSVLAVILAAWGVRDLATTLERFTGGLLALVLTPMKPTALALASAFALSSTWALAKTVRHESNVRTHPIYKDAAPSIVSKYGNSNRDGNRDVWGHWGTYYGPMIPSGAGGR